MVLFPPMHIEGPVLQRALAALSQEQLLESDLPAGLLEIIGAVPGLFGSDGAGILLIDEDSVLRYAAGTDDSARALEHAQEATGHGPCVECLVDNVTVEVTDLATDPRWPDLAELLRPKAMRAILGLPIRLAGTPIGSLNIYKHEPYTWTDEEQEALASFQRIVERFLAAAISAERNEVLVGQLQHALDARILIERAIGFIMASEGVSAPKAFERIRRAARSSRRPAKEIAEAVIQGKGFSL